MIFVLYEENNVTGPRKESMLCQVCVAPPSGEAPKPIIVYAPFPGSLQKAIRVRGGYLPAIQVSCQTNEPMVAPLEYWTRRFLQTAE